MKTQNLVNHRAVVLCLTLAMIQNISASPITIQDNFYGATGTGDIVGDSRFDVDSMEVDRIGNSLYVTINTNFVNYQGVKSNYTIGANQGSGLGIAVGDLFLTGDGWNPFGNAANNYAADDASNGTNWTYGFSLDNRWNSTDMSVNDGKLYSLTSSDNNDNSYLSNDFISSAPSTFRHGQEVAVDTTSGLVFDTLNTGTWMIDKGENSLSFILDVTGTDLATSNNIALHWGMTCGNDVIEGAAALGFVSDTAAVPAPFAILMIGAGLIGLAGFKKYNA